MIKISSLILSSFILIALSSFIYISDKAILPSNIIFEIMLLSLYLILFIRLKINNKMIIIFLLANIYILTGLIQYFLQDVKMYDFLLIYKSFFYISILSFFVGKEILRYAFLRSFFNVLILLFLLKYTLVIILAPDERPELFTENNFELIMLLIIYVGVYSREKVINKWDLIILFIIFILSGSRSAMGAYLVMLYFLDFGTKRQIKLLKLFFLIVGLSGLIVIFIQRLGSGSLEDIDRVKFFYYFLNEINSWSIYNYFFGAPFMTPMSYETSQSLSFYYLLYSNHDTLLTYSVILHSYLLRMLFDHGLIGLWFVFYSIWMLLKYSAYSKNERFSIISILIVTGLSVSSINSIFVALSLGLIMLTKRKEIHA